MSAISRAIDKFPGGQAALARELNVRPQAVSQWLARVKDPQGKRGRPIPPRLALLIESLTGVSRHDLRPDIFGEASAATGQAV
ncbi:transcriptional regulator [Lysobacter enzymogenes]|uniref:transcriptional regulator n=1 Tax=Lysobacter enzymogenes TaxID=69 RepID=UPI00385099FB